MSAPSLLTLLDAMLLEQGDEVLDGVCAGDLFRLRQFVVSESSKSSFTLLTPPLSAAQEHQAVEVSSPSAAILQIGLSDVLLQCADGTQHPAHSFVLAFHSPILGKEIEAAMVPIPASSDSIDPRQGTRRPLPVISLDTSPETLAVLFGLCYGTTSPPSQLPLLASALVASKRYAMPQAEKLIAERWDELTKLSPLEAYFVAIQHGLETCARAAAMVVLEHPITTSYVEVMECSSALAYRRILEYYSSCTDAVGDHLKTVVSKWTTAATCLDHCPHQQIAPSRGLYPYMASCRHQSSVETYLSGIVRSVQDHGPQCN
ncbi:hypothetical protein LXA43DRAFT_1017420 [Ganoderma leucocontextum]|nr:hypothetical protein LXA43DRAFT_1017420 [Ganoderma leucocontextum]